MDRSSNVMLDISVMLYASGVHAEVDVKLSHSYGMVSFIGNGYFHQHHTKWSAKQCRNNGTLISAEITKLK